MKHKTEALPALTSIRGVAAVGVVLFHLRDSYSGQTNWLEFFSRGSMGVDLFFVLSGFILAHVYGNFNGQAPAKLDWHRFIVARVARIYPLHLVTLLAMLMLVMTWPAFARRYEDYTSTFSFVLNLLLIQNWGLIRVSWNIPSWSISAEWLMYLLFPLLAMPRFWTTASSSKLLALMFIIVSAQLTLVHYKGWNDYGGMALGGMSRVLFEFSLGFAARHYWNRVDPGPTLALNSAQIAFATGLLVCTAFEPLWFCFVPLAAALICTLACRDAVLSRILSVAPLVYLGEISYSLYMWHWLILNSANTANAPSWLEGWSERYAVDVSAAAQLAVTIFAAVLSYHFLEQPCRQAIMAGQSKWRSARKLSIAEPSASNSVDSNLPRALKPTKRPTSDG